MRKIDAYYDCELGAVFLEPPIEPNEMEILYTEDQVAKMFGVTVWTIRYWRREGLISYVSVARTIRFTHEQVTEFIERNSIQAVRRMSPSKATLADVG